MPFGPTHLRDCVPHSFSREEAKGKRQKAEGRRQYRTKERPLIDSALVRSRGAYSTDGLLFCLYLPTAFCLLFFARPALSPLPARRHARPIRARTRRNKS